MPEQEVRKNEKARQSKPAASRSIRTKQVVTIIGTVATVVTCLLFIFGACLRIERGMGVLPRLTSRYPQLHDVCIMQWRYVHGDKVIGRDSLPISPRDFRLLVDERIMPPWYVIWSEETINKTSFIDYHPIILIEMHDNFKSGPELSYNFHEKYGKLVFIYWARFVVIAVLAIVSLIVMIVGISLPGHVEEIGERGGESWE